MQKISVVQVVSGLELSHGGPSYSVPRLNMALIAAGINGLIFNDLTRGDLASEISETIVTFHRQFGATPLLRKLHLSGKMHRRLISGDDRFDLIHSHGLWRLPNIYAARAASRQKIPHVISPRGMLSQVALDFSRAGKLAFWYAAQKSAVLQAACLHATCDAEHDEIRNAGFRGPIALIPNGIDLPDQRFLSLSEGNHPTRTLLFLGRIHPKKGLDVLIGAWAKCAATFPQWRLRIVGPADSTHMRWLNQLVTESGAPRVSIDGPAFGDAKWQIYQDADLFVLPSQNENFGLTVAESLACRRPVIVSKGAPWDGVEIHRCGWWVDANEQALADVMRTALETPRCVLDEMGLRGQAWMREAYSWSKIGVEMASAYAWLLGQGSRPTFVHMMNNWR